MHDGLTFTLDDAIRRHAGQAEPARENYERLSHEEREQVVRFLRSL
jgi:CxxC motif-containing protein (DUF1111 family)